MNKFPVLEIEPHTEEVAHLPESQLELPDWFNFDFDPSEVDPSEVDLNLLGGDGHNGIDKIISEQKNTQQRKLKQQQQKMKMCKSKCFLCGQIEITFGEDSKDGY